LTDATVRLRRAIEATQASDSYRVDATVTDAESQAVDAFAIDRTPERARILETHDGVRVEGIGIGNSAWVSDFDRDGFYNALPNGGPGWRAVDRSHGVLVALAEAKEVDESGGVYSVQLRDALPFGDGTTRVRVSIRSEKIRSIHARAPDSVWALRFWFGAVDPIVKPRPDTVIAPTDRACSNGRDSDQVFCVQGSGDPE
jgi:hypothetical protein